VDLTVDGAHSFFVGQGGCWCTTWGRAWAWSKAQACRLSTDTALATTLRANGKSWLGRDANRGHDQQSCRDPTVWDLHGGVKTAATAYERADGTYVVVNELTNEVIQASDIYDAGWQPVWLDPRFQR